MIQTAKGDASRGNVRPAVFVYYKIVSPGRSKDAAGKAHRRNIASRCRCQST
jgi:hypothetical protein